MAQRLLSQRLLSQLAHVEVLTLTPQDSLDFYTSVLGLEESGCTTVASSPTGTSWRGHHRAGRSAQPLRERGKSGVSEGRPA